jgi:hypothetical protein
VKKQKIPNKSGIQSAKHVFKQEGLQGLINQETEERRAPMEAAMTVEVIAPKLDPKHLTGSQDEARQE